MKLSINYDTPEWLTLIRDRAQMARSRRPLIPSDSFSFIGDIAGLFQTHRRRIAILGSRDISAADLTLIQRIVQALARPSADNPSFAKPIILSGLAIGTDTVVHRTALGIGLPTVAVMATGLDMIYPHVNTNLAERIASSENSGLLTQFKEGSAPLALNFLERTATIVLMSDAVIIPVCKKKGSSLVAARLAHSWGIPVIAVPGRFDDPRYAGCNLLIKEGMADILTDYQEIESLVM